MPRTRSLETYPNAHFGALCKRVLAENGPFLVACTAPQAASIRGEIYAWRRACEAAPDQAFTYGIDVKELREVAFRVGPEGLTGIPSSMLIGPGLIEAALGGIVAQKSAAQIALEKMQGMGLAPATPNGG